MRKLFLHVPPRLAFASLFICLFLYPANAQSAAVSAENGLQKAAFTTPHGRIIVALPDDMAAGDTISGTVYAEPAGQTDTERANNLGQLNGYVLDVAGQRQSSWQGGKALVIFTLTTGVACPLILRSGSGQTVGSHTLPVQPTASAPGGFQLPEISQQGRPLPITGPFDGKFDNTTCSIGSRPLEIIAESPRQAVFRSPADITGPTDIKLKEGNTETSGQIRNLGVKLTAPKTNLLRGEKTTLAVQVSGLQGITTSVPLNLDCTGAVKMQGGNRQNIEIQPGQVQSDGSFSRAFGLTATQTGGFNVTGTVLGPGQPVKKGNCECKCEFATPPIVTAGKREAEGGGTENGFEPNVNISCNGNRCEVQSVEYVWTVGAGSTATYTVHKGTDKLKKLVVDVTKDGALELTVKVTVTCSDGTTCSKTGSKTFAVKKK
jgi:hypothetical protein